MKQTKLIKAKGVMALLAFFLVSGIAISVAVPSKSEAITDSRVEALSKCEITNGNGDIIFLCRGEEGTCSAEKLGFHLTCSGTQVIPAPEDN